jgi:hypothetical protein
MTLDRNAHHEWDPCKGLSWIEASGQLQDSYFLSMILTNGEVDRARKRPCAVKARPR